MEQAERTIHRVQSYCATSCSHCGVICEVEDGKLTKVLTDPDHPNGGICIKGKAGPEVIYHPQRLLQPLKRTTPKGSKDPGWQRISWDEALDTMASTLRELRERHGAESVVFCRPAPGGSSACDYDHFVMRFANAFGSPNTVATTHVCNWHKDVGSSYTYGIGIPPADFRRAACILIWGHNPTASWHIHAQRISRAKARGAKLLVIDPLRNRLAAKADLWLQVRPGSDGALALSLIATLIEEELYDAAFVRSWTNAPFLVRPDTGALLRAADLQEDGGEGYVVWDESRGAPVSHLRLRDHAVRPALRGTYHVSLADGRTLSCRPAFEGLAELAAAYTPERAAAIHWVPAQQVRAAARMFTQNGPSCYYTYNGLEQHTNAMQTNRAVCIFYALSGFFDAPGGNVIFPTVPSKNLQGTEFLPAEQARRRLGIEKRPLGPPSTGAVQAYEVYTAILTGKPYPVKGFVSFGGNIVQANGDSQRGYEALRQLDFYAQVELFETPTSRLADLLLPAATHWEAGTLRVGFGQDETTSGYVQYRQPVIEPLGESRPDVRIIFDLAQRMCLGEKFWRGDIEAAWREQLSPSGLNLEELRRHPGGVNVPLPVRFRKYRGADEPSATAPAFNTPTGKIEIYSERFLAHGFAPLPVYEEPFYSEARNPDLARQYPHILITVKVLQFCHGQHRAMPSLRGAVPYPTIEVHPQTAAALRIADGEWVAVETFHGSVRLKASLSTRLDPRVVVAQHGWWQECPGLDLPGFDPFSSSGANINLVYTNDQVDPITGSVPFKSFRCRLRKLAADAAE
ncbi:MAG: molybdopterin-dependent oxidoreductase [Candidatus Tectomicrobia bacterium]|nr:molybdopterin-dependent oxidoreductase [Candidatus Tectomicrobia bacterium]